MTRNKGKQRTAVNTAESATLSINETILHECYKLYADEENGMIRLGEEVGLTLEMPRKKITVLLIGNHSAGKSSFINWYIEEHVQRTSVAIETQGFSLITSGKTRDSLTGITSLHVFPHIKDLQQIEGVMDYLNTEVSSSKQKMFSLVTFIDSPGLVDGEMKYPFNVSEAIVLLGNLSDLICVLFDPLGQALCKRTLDILDELNKNNAGKLRLYLSKADTAGVEKDRQRVLIQITQEICKRPGLNKAGFEMPTIFIPSLAGKNVTCENQIGDLCSEIEKTINRSIQNTLNKLEKDAKEIGKRMEEKLRGDKALQHANFAARCRSILLYLLGVFFLLTLLAPIGHRLFGVVSGSLNFDVFFSPFFAVWRLFPDDYHVTGYALCLLFASMFLFLGSKLYRTAPTMSRGQRKQYTDKMTYLKDFVQRKKNQLYNDYLKQSVELT